MRSGLLVVLLALSALSACKGDPVECDQACRNFATLVHWKKTDAEIAAAPPEKRDTMKRRKIAEFENKLENGIDQCVAQCVSAHNADQTHCMMEAKTADDVEACVK
jgi:hypothetical protein